MNTPAGSSVAIADQILETAVRDAAAKIADLRHTSPAWRVVRAERLLRQAAEAADALLDPTARAA